MDVRNFAALRRLVSFNDKPLAGDRKRTPMHSSSFVKKRSSVARFVVPDDCVKGNNLDVQRSHFCLFRINRSAVASVPVGAGGCPGTIILDKKISEVRPER
ncbi:MAG: hypothetical protein LBG65_02420 [Puniceicoccales bacterium]|nr:hypothetical protein [Puniceicoccales bacterium]